MEIIVYIAVIVAIVLRLVIMKGNFVLPTFYKIGNEVSFNLGSISTIIIAIIAALGLMYTYPEQFANPYMAFVTTYAAPQLVDGIITFGTRQIAAAEKDNDDDDVEFDEDEVA